MTGDATSGSVESFLDVAVCATAGTEVPEDEMGLEALGTLAEVACDDDSTGMGGATVEGGTGGVDAAEVAF